MRQYLILVFTSLLVPLHGRADTGPLGFGEPAFRDEMETDRPDFTEATSVIDPGHLQLETGYTFTRRHDSEGKEHEHDLPELLGRIGIIPDFELRLEWLGYDSITTSPRGNGPDIHTDGVTDLGIGWKHRLYEQSETLPALSYIFTLGLPVGSSELSSERVEPKGKILWSFDLTEKDSIAGNINASWLKGESGRFLETSASFSYNRSLCDTLAAYSEYFGFYPAGGGADTEDVQHYLNGGITWMVAENTQLDVRVGFGLNERADDIFSGLGLSWRI